MIASRRMNHTGCLTNPCQDCRGTDLLQDLMDSMLNGPIHRKMLEASQHQADDTD